MPDTHTPGTSNPSHFRRPTPLRQQMSPPGKFLPLSLPLVQAPAPARAPRPLYPSSNCPPSKTMPPAPKCDCPATRIDVRSPWEDDGHIAEVTNPRKRYRSMCRPLFLCVALFALLSQPFTAAQSPAAAPKPPAAEDTVGEQHVKLGTSMADLTGPWRFHPGDDAAWAAPNFDDSSWVTMDLTPDKTGDVPGCLSGIPWDHEPFYGEQVPKGREHRHGQ